MKKILLLSLCLLSGLISFAYSPSDSTTTNPDSLQALIKEIEASLKYQTGDIDLKNGLAKINVPAGYKFLDAEQSQYVLTDLWNNPRDENTLGMLFREDISPLSENTWAIEITYAEDGYIKDDDAKDMDYDELLADMQKDTKEGNAELVKQGYSSMQLVGWAVPPFYDAKTNKLHWAKEIKVDESEENTLNYNIRILGRKGYLMLNAIGGMKVLPEVQKDMDKILTSVDFNSGNKYADFNPSVDQVAAYGIGSLIAGKVLAKTGFFVLLLKFWKIIAAGAAGIFYFIKRFLTGEKAEERERVNS